MIELVMGLTRNEKSIIRSAVGIEPRRRTDARICERCNSVVNGREWVHHCGQRTIEFRSKYLKRFCREAPQNVRAIPEQVVNRDYRNPFATFLSGGLPESNRRRH